MYFYNMNQLIKNILSFLLFIVLIISSVSTTAQIWDSPYDSLELIRIEKRKRVQAVPEVQEKVDEEINEYRLLMSAYEWWELPTDREQKRIDKARNERYMPYASPLENSEWRNSNPTFYRNQESLYSKQELIVLGWHPYWEGKAYNTYNFELLTHLAFYGYEVNPFTGGYKNFRAIYEFQNNDLIPTAHLDSCKVLLTVSMRGEDAHDIFFTSEPQVRQNLIDSLVSILEYADADGVDLDFEAVPYEYKQDFLQFVEDLSFTLREYNNSYIISMSLPVEDKYNIYELKSLKPWIDFFTINGFNFHIQPDQLKKGPLAPLKNEEAAMRGTRFTYEKYSTLAELLAEDFTISSVTLLHEESYIERLKDSLNMYIRSTYSTIEYEDYDITSILNTLQITQTEGGTPLWLLPGINGLLSRTKCTSTLVLETEAKAPKEETQFFLFEPEKDKFKVKEYALFKEIEKVSAEMDTTRTRDLASVVEDYKARIGTAHESSLVLGLPYHGAVWYRPRGEEAEFEGYMPYSEILKIIEDDKAKVDYDKTTHSLTAIQLDSLGGLYYIYFDNSTTLGYKYDYAIDAGLGGVGVWALGADHAHTELWATLEESFVTRRVWNEELGRNDRIYIEKGNKISYTINYMLKYFSPLTFATIFFITIFIGISFCFSVLDWKVRDVLFYSGAFRILYLVLFTVVLLVIANTFHIFDNPVMTFGIGAVIGLVLTWVASNLVQKKHQKLP